MKTIIITLGLLFLNINFAFSQCPPSTTCTTTWTTVEHDLDEILDNPGFTASATFSYRINCDGDFEFIVENIDIRNNSNYLDEFDYLHFNFSSITEKVVLDYMMTQDALGDASTSVPTFPNTIKRIFVYTAKCGIWLRCSYKLPSTIEKECDTPWNGPAPDYPGGADRWVDHWRWHSCGEVCCKKVYEITRRGFSIEIRGKTKSRYPIEEECSKQGDFWGKRPTPIDGSIELPCEDGC